MSAPVNHRSPTETGALIEMVTEVNHKIDQMDQTLRRHMMDETVQLAQEVQRLMKSAFPDGDPDGHRRAHEVSIARAEAKADFWRAMTKELGKWGLVGFIGWAGYALWTAFLHGPRG